MGRLSGKTAIVTGGAKPTTAALAFEDMVLSDVAALQKLRP